MTMKGNKGWQFNFSVIIDVIKDKCNLFRRLVFMKVPFLLCVCLSSFRADVG